MAFRTQGILPFVSVVLTAKEARTLKHVLLGKGFKQIALELGLSPQTIKNQLSNVYKKTGAQNRTELFIVVAQSYPEALPANISSAQIQRVVESETQSADTK